MLQEMAFRNLCCTQTQVTKTFKYLETFFTHTSSHHCRTTCFLTSEAPLTVGPPKARVNTINVNAPRLTQVIHISTLYSHKLIWKK